MVWAEEWAKAGVLEEAGELRKHIKPIEFRGLLGRYERTLLSALNIKKQVLVLADLIVKADIVIGF